MTELEIIASNHKLSGRSVDQEFFQVSLSYLLRVLFVGTGLRSLWSSGSDLGFAIYLVAHQGSAPVLPQKEPQDAAF